MFGIDFLFAAQPLAYVGPGLGAGAVAVVLGLLASVGLAIFALAWYPIKRLLRLGRNNKVDK